MKNIGIPGLVFVLLTTAPLPALAYIGPGAGITVIGSVLAVLAAIAVVVFSIVWYPIRRLRQRRAGKIEKPESDGPASEENQPGD